MTGSGIRRRAVLGAGAVAVAVGGMGWWRWWAERDSPAVARPVEAVGTARVLRTNLAAREQVGGTLGFAGEYLIVPAGPPGLLTAVPPLGTVVQRGQTLYEVDGRPVRLLYGDRPAWRDLAIGQPPGADVRQLEENLAALGYLESTVDDRFTSATATAIRRWQAHLGVAQTGRLDLGTVVFAPEPLRLAALLTPVGAPVGPSPVLRATSTRRVVTVALPTARQGNVQVGGPVLVALPGGQPLPATVTEVGRVAVTVPGDPGRPVGPPTITVTATLNQPDVVGPLDQLPVQVSITTGERRGVLAVPVTALMAAGPDGYQVAVVDGDSRRLVAVRPGLQDELSGLVEVSGDGLAEGMTVEVPVR